MYTFATTLASGYDVELDLDIDSNSCHVTSKNMVTIRAESLATQFQLAGFKGVTLQYIEDGTKARVFVVIPGYNYTEGEQV